MQDYRHFGPEELATDSSFQRWKLDNDPIASLFWNDWLAQNPDKDDLIEKAYWLLLTINEFSKQRIDEQDQLTDAEVQQEINRLSNSLSRLKPAPIRWLGFVPVSYGIAASVLLLLGLFGWYLVRPAAVRESHTYSELTAQATTPLTEVTNTTAEPRLVNLPDQSLILLYPQSRISFSKQFSGPKREVYLSGKAFFDVAKNPSRPFYVYADNLVTKVLGTSFTVQTNESAQQVSVVVKTGKVSVYAQNQAPSVPQPEDYKLSGTVLTPNQQVIFSTNDTRMVKQPVRVPVLPEKAVAQQVFSFKRTPIADVFTTLEQAYNVQIIFDEPLMKNCYLTASFTDEALSDKLALICHTINAHYSQLNGYIVINSQGCQ